MGSKYITKPFDITLENGVRIEIDNLDPTYIATVYAPDGEILEQEAFPANMKEVVADILIDKYRNWKG